MGGENKLSAINSVTVPYALPKPKTITIGGVQIEKDLIESIKTEGNGKGNYVTLKNGIKVDFSSKTKPAYEGAVSQIYLDGEGFTTFSNMPEGYDIFCTHKDDKISLKHNNVAGRVFTSYGDDIIKVEDTSLVDIDYNGKLTLKDGAYETKKPSLSESTIKGNPSLLENNLFWTERVRQK